MDYCMILTVGLHEQPTVDRRYRGTRERERESLFFGLTHELADRHI
jgi:hypothetical protein